MRRIAILLVVCALALTAAAQQPAANGSKGLSVTHLIGMEKVARNAKGTLTIAGDKIQFDGGKGASTELAIGAIETGQTADDSKPLIRGARGTRSMFGAYGAALLP